MEKIITYKDNNCYTGGYISVFLDYKKVGKIKQVEYGWRYFPTGGMGGDVFNTLDQLKDSLEQD